MERIARGHRGGFNITPGSVYLARSVRVYRREDGDWGWRRQAENNAITAVSGEGYTERNDAVAAARLENPGLAVDAEPEG